MPPSRALPFPDNFETAEEYVNSLLDFATSDILFQTLCGGVHILDFFTRELSLYDTVLPEDWRLWLESVKSMDLLDFLIRNDTDLESSQRAPTSLLTYVKDIRKHSLTRSFTPRQAKQDRLPRHVAVGMVPKKIHEVTNFASYVDRLAEDIAIPSMQKITHFVDFGSGQNYLGRALASPPYNRHIVAVESRELNNTAAKRMDVLAKVAEREVVMRNKKLYKQQLAGNIIPTGQLKENVPQEPADTQEAASVPKNVADLRPVRELATIYTQGAGKGSIQYVEEMVDTGNLSNMVAQIRKPKLLVSNSTLTPGLEDQGIAMVEEVSEIEPRLMAISIHSCGNLSHHGIRSLLLNPSVQAIAIVGCCYNLLTEKLGPPTYKLPLLRPNMQAINGHPRLTKESTACDPHGYPMSNRVSTYNQQGIRLNITARMMAVQAPSNWTEKESDSFFTRHYYRALLQKVFLDYGVVSKPNAQHSDGADLSDGGTEPIIIGSLRKSCYVSFVNYVRGAITKLCTHEDHRTTRVQKMEGITDEAIQAYADAYAPRKKELSIMWSLMAFSAGVVESLIVVDRWLYLKEHQDIVKDAWVEAVFDYQLSPRNLVVVGVKN